MIELWHAPDTRSFRVLWALEELRLPYQLHLLPFPPRVLQPDYLAVNPLGTVPAFIDGEVTMTESVAIIQYLATRYFPNDLAIGAEHPAFGEWLNWLYFGEATLTFPQTIVLRYRQFEPERADVAADDYSRWFLSRLKKVEAHLEGRKWLVADRFTAADISVGYALLLAEYLQLADFWKGNVAAYWERLKRREAFCSAKARQGIELKELLSDARPEL